MTAGVIDELTAAVEELTIAPGADELVAAFRARDRFEARLAEGFTAYYASGGCDADGFRSPVAWLRAHVPLTEGEAKALGARAKALVLWPTLARLWFDGQLNSAQIAVIVAAVPRKLMGFYADYDDDISPLFVGLCVGDTKTAITDWVKKADSVTSPDPQEVVDPDQPRVEGQLRVSRYGSEDTAAIKGEADGDTATIIEAALGAAERPDADGELRSPGQRRLEALRSVCEFYLSHADCEGGAGLKATMAVVMDLPDLYRSILAGLGVHDGLSLERFLTTRSVSVPEEGILRYALVNATGTARTLDGLQLSPAAITTIFGAGSTMERVLMAKGQVLDHGRKVRLAKGPLRDAMLLRDLGCRFPTATGERCDAPIAWIDGHHLTQWDHDGETSLTNLVCLCATHHGVVHRNGWKLTAEPDGTITLTRPDATTLTSPPPWANRPPKLPLHHWRLNGIIPNNDDEDVDDANDVDGDDQRRNGQSCPLTQPVLTVTLRLPDDDDIPEAAPAELDAGDPAAPDGTEVETTGFEATTPIAAPEGLTTGCPHLHRPRRRPRPLRAPGLARHASRCRPDFVIAASPSASALAVTLDRRPPTGTQLS